MSALARSRLGASSRCTRSSSRRTRLGTGRILPLILRAMPKRLPRARTLKGEPKLAYYDSGGGIPGEPAIVLAHGALARSEDWENVFPRLATRYRVVAYDQRGHGRSGRAASYTLRDFGDDALRVLREIVKSPAAVVGASLGALCALAAAAAAEGPVAGVVLEEPPLRYAAAGDAACYGDLRGAR